MGDDQTAAIGEKTFERGPKHFLGQRVQVRRGFVEDDRSRVLDQDPGDGQSLSFPTRDLIAVASDRGVDPVRQGSDKGDETGRIERGPEFVRGRRRIPEPQVLGDGAALGERFLGDKADRGSRLFGGEFSDVPSAQQNPPGGGREQAARQIAERGFARAAESDDGNHLAFAHDDVHRADRPGGYGHVRCVGVRDVRQDEIAVNGRSGNTRRF